MQGIVDSGVSVKEIFIDGRVAGHLGAANALKKKQIADLAVIRTQLSLRW